MYQDALAMALHAKPAVAEVLHAQVAIAMALHAETDAVAMVVRQWLSVLPAWNQCSATLATADDT